MEVSQRVEESVKQRAKNRTAEKFTISMKITLLQSNFHANFYQDK